MDTQKKVEKGNFSLFHSIGSSQNCPVRVKWYKGRCPLFYQNRQNTSEIWDFLSYWEKFHLRKTLILSDFYCLNSNFSFLLHVRNCRISSSEVHSLMRNKISIKFIFYMYFYFLSFFFFFTFFSSFLFLSFLPFFLHFFQ